jgi:hypothetical protein
MHMHSMRESNKTTTATKLFSRLAIGRSKGEIPESIEDGGFRELPQGFAVLSKLPTYLRSSGRCCCGERSLHPTMFSLQRVDEDPPVHPMQ